MEIRDKKTNEFVCNTGIKTKLNDSDGNILYTGDIVAFVYEDNINKIRASIEISMVVEGNKENFYVQGICGVIENKIKGWKIFRVKNSSELVDNEICRNFIVKDEKTLEKNKKINNFINKKINIINTILAYYMTNKEVLSQQESMEILEQISILNNLQM